MKAIASVLTLLAFAAAAHAEDANAPAAATGVEPAEQSVAPAAAPAASQGTVARAAVTRAIENREPVDEVSDVTTDTERLYYFTELRGMEGETVTHRWEHNGQTMAEVAFQVGGPRWRVYSSKNLMSDWTGEWQVSVVDFAGNVLHRDTFMYTEAPAPSATSGAASPDAASGAAPDMKADASPAR